MARIRVRVKKAIPGFPGYYATEDGRIWSNAKAGSGGHAGRWLKAVVSWDGHLRIVLYRNGERHRKLVHRLILETFIGPCPVGMETCHNNGNPSDNRVENLRWDTHSNNNRDAVKHGTHVGNTKLNSWQIRIIKRLLQFGSPTQREIAGVFKVCLSTISNIRAGKTWEGV